MITHESENVDDYIEESIQNIVNDLNVTGSCVLSLSHLIGRCSETVAHAIILGAQHRFLKTARFRYGSEVDPLRDE